jgi:hypothetical protein
MVGAAFKPSHPLTATVAPELQRSMRKVYESARIRRSVCVRLFPTCVISLIVWTGVRVAPEQGVDLRQ